MQGCDWIGMLGSDTSTSWNVSIRYILPAEYSFHAGYRVLPIHTDPDLMSRCSGVDGVLLTQEIIS